MSSVKLGVLGGSGLYDMKELQDIKRIGLHTPFGDPSDEYVVGSFEGVEMVFLPRHGRGHRILPSELNFRANIYGFKSLGVEWLISVSAVGSMREGIAPGHVVVVDQFFDNTKMRKSTFFGEGVVAHVAMAQPVCPELSGILYSSAKELGATAHMGGTYLCIEGPQFSSRAESQIYRKWGVDVIGMTNAPEAKLAREAEICYATLALATDYDCWHQDEEEVSVDVIIETLKKNAALAQQIIKKAAKKIAPPRDCICSKALEGAIITARDSMPKGSLGKLELLIGKYIS